MNALNTLLRTLGVSQHSMARDTQLSQATISRIAHGRWPLYGAKAARQNITAFLTEQGALPEQLDWLWAETSKLTADLGQGTAAIPEMKQPKEETMLLRPDPLSMAARKQFALPFASPFDGDVTSDADLFINSELRFIRETVWQSAIGGHFLALVGESGSGKTTILDSLKFQIRKERKPMVFIQPGVQSMEDRFGIGRPLRINDIETAIISTLDEMSRVSQSGERRMRQVKAMLTESTLVGNSHLLVIEEAHAIPVPTLRHLKRLNEAMRIDGAGDVYHKRMLGILLIGHPELERKLRRFDVREVMQRCHVCRLSPLGQDLEAYLEFRASNAGRKLDEFITPDGVEELRARLRVNAGGADAPISMLYPLNVNNWMVAALNAAASIGAPRVDRDVIRSL